MARRQEARTDFQSLARGRFRLVRAAHFVENHALLVKQQREIETVLRAIEGPPIDLDSFPRSALGAGIVSLVIEHVGEAMPAHCRIGMLIAQHLHPELQPYPDE